MIVRSIMNHCLTHTHVYVNIVLWLTSMKNTVPHVRCSYQPKHALENTSGYSYHEKWDMIFTFWLRNIVHNIYNKKLPLLTFIYILHKVIRRESYIYQSTDTIYLSVCVFSFFSCSRYQQCCSRRQGSQSISSSSVRKERLFHTLNLRIKYHQHTRQLYCNCYCGVEVIRTSTNDFEDFSAAVTFYSAYVSIFSYIKILAMRVLVSIWFWLSSKNRCVGISLANFQVSVSP